MKLEAEKIFTLFVQCEQGKIIGDDGAGMLQVIPIISGSFTGKINGKIIKGGADWNTACTNGLAHVFAKYMLQTEDGICIAIENEGKILASEKFKTIKTFTRFQVANESIYSWLNSGVYVGSLDGTENQGEVKIEIFKLE
ncbi:MAG: DUF3237 domain-containing protein [Ruthenibacterium sp.]